MTDHISNRDRVVRAIVEELVGPSPTGEELDCSGRLSFASREDSYGPWKQKGTGEEILQRDPPTKRYGLGVLYPLGAREDGERMDEAGLDGAGFIAAAAPEGVEAEANDTVVEKLHKNLEKLESRLVDAREEGNRDLDLSLANAYRPSSMAVSFFAEFPEGSRLIVEAAGGRYEHVPVQVEERQLKWGLRSPGRLRTEYTGGGGS